MTFGERIACLRKREKLSQEELADMLGLSRAAISMYEIDKREPDHETLQRLADFFGVSVDYLLCRTNEPNPRDVEGHPPVDMTPEEHRLLDAARHLDSDAVNHLARFVESVAAGQEPEARPGKVTPLHRREQSETLAKPKRKNSRPLPDTDNIAARRTGDENLLSETQGLIGDAQEEVREKHLRPHPRTTP